MFGMATSCNLSNQNLLDFCGPCPGTLVSHWYTKDNLRSFNEFVVGGFLIADREKYYVKFT